MPISNFMLHFVWWLFDVSVFSGVITAAVPELIQTLKYFGLRRNNRLWPFPVLCQLSHCNSCFFSSAMEFGYIWFYYSSSFISYKNTISEGHQFSCCHSLNSLVLCHNRL